MAKVDQGSFLGTLLGSALGPVVNKAVGWALKKFGFLLWLLPLTAVGWYTTLSDGEQLVFWLVLLGLGGWWVVYALEQRFDGRRLDIRAWRPVARPVVPLERQRTAVYRLYDETGLFLYVGISNDPARRLEQHAADPEKRHWWWRVDPRQTTVEWYPDRPTAKAEETAWIVGAGGMPRPLFNVAEQSGAA